MSTRTDAVCLYLTAMWVAAFTDVEVRDGPQVEMEAGNRWLYVGYDGDRPDSNTEMADADEEWLTFGTKEETNKLKCSVIVKTGDKSIAPVRQAAFQILATAEAALRADVRLGGLVLQALITGHQYYPSITQAGAVVRLVFTVTYQAQIS